MNFEQRSWGLDLKAPKFLLPLVILLSISGCAGIKLPWATSNPPLLPKNWKEYGPTDYTKQMASFEKMCLSGEGIKELKLDRGISDYLINISLTILQNNELFFKDGSDPKLHIVQNNVPFHFSLPGRVIFLSTALVNKYVKHEAMLAAILSYELIRSEKSLYTRTIIVPVGYMPIERMLGINRLDLDDKIQIHKWAYYAMRRAGFDGSYYLAWLQTVNRNTADFLTMLGDPGGISREEANFKAFQVRRSKMEDARTFSRKDSSKDFYKFLFFVKDKSA